MMCGGSKDRATWVSSVTNEEPLVVMKACVDIVWEVVRENHSDSHNGVVWKGETPLRRGGDGSVGKRTTGTEDRDICRGWSGGGHWGSEVFSSRGGDENVVWVNGNIFVKRGEEESVEDFLGDSGRSGRHSRWGDTIEPVSFL